MIEIAPGVRPTMALELVPSAFQARATPITPELVYQLGKAGPGWSVRIDGQLVALGGYTELWHGRAALWGFLGAHCRPAMVAMTRRVRAEIEALDYERVEAYVALSHVEGHRWIRMLGFQREGTMRRFSRGMDYTLYARVR